MESASHGREATRDRWKRRLKGLAYLALGVPFALFTFGLILATADIDDYYHVPEACRALECVHDVVKAPDGRVHCATYPPKDIKMSRVSDAYVLFCQVMVGVCGVVGLAGAGATAVFGGRWLIGPAHRPAARWLVRLRQLAPFVAVGLSLLALPFLWPYGIVPM
ncbi:MAG: hypothetical protein R6X20_13425 [Phycisphaerae bacterium]